MMVNRRSSEFRYPLARLPAGSVATLPDGRSVRIPEGALFAAGSEGSEVSGGEFLAMADHSVFINQMLLEPVTDNLELAYRTVEFLQGANNNKKKRCLFIENGRVVIHLQ